MLKFLSQLDPQEELSFDVCIVGAGAAGITIANKLSAARLSVCLLEAGGLEATAEGQSLYAGDAAGYAPLDGCRLRFFGGTTNHWTGYCREPDEEDLRFHQWESRNGWPIGLEDIAGFLPEARAIVEVPDTFAVEYWERTTGLRSLGINNASLFEDVSLIGPPVRFREKYKAVLEASPNVMCILHANVAEFVPDVSGTRIDYAVVKTPQGQARSLAAGCFVLACGGIENARLLLNSDSVMPGGIGNRYDLVGRFFADHCIRRSGSAVLTRPQDQPLIYEEGQLSDRVARAHPQIRTRLALADKVGGTRTLIRLNPEPVSRFSQTIEEWAALTGVQKGVSRSFAISAFTEPLPLPENRITLTSDRDSLGMRRIRLQYEPSPREREAIRQALQQLALVLGANGKGHVRIDDSALNDAACDWGFHHYSTTKMNPDAAHGVVDVDCRVHGMSNLFVAGSSVFPAAGIMTPTLTIVALALRLAAKLKGELNG